MKAVELKLLAELMKNSRKSDRELSKAIGSSQPTVSRTRQKLEKQGTIKEYTMIPDFNKLGISIMALTFAAWSPETLKEHPLKARIEKELKFIKEHPNVVFASSGRGLGMANVLVTAHKHYSDYAKFMTQIEEQWAGLLSKLESFTISLKADKVVFPLSIRNLMQYVTETE